MAYLTAAQVRERVARSGSTDPLTGLTDTVVDGYVAEFEQVAEDYIDEAYQARTATEVHRVRSDTTTIALDRTNATAITSITVDGLVLGADTYELDKLAGIVRRTTGSFSPTYPVTIVYTYGTGTVPEMLKRACALYVQRVAEAEKSGQGRDLIAQGIDGGTTRYSTPDKAAGRPTGWLEVDRLLNVLRPRIPGIG